jgi:hypothetical protein
MLKVIISAFTLALFIAFAGASSAPIQAETTAASSEAIGKDAKPVRVPFRGKIAAIDKAAMTLSLEGKEKRRVISITSQTKFTKAGAPATLEDAIVGEEVGGLAQRTEDGKEEAVSVRLGEKPNGKAAAKPSRASQ